MATGFACEKVKLKALNSNSLLSAIVDSTPPVSVVALVGNPNAGKTTLFNALTGAHQKVGNYPGVTVEKVTGALRLTGKAVECLDVPGMYSLQAVSEDERVAVAAVLGESIGGESASPAPDLLVCVVDATNLERNLYLFSQLSELGLPTIVALTMVDRLKSQGKTISVEDLSIRLGVDVVPIVGHKDKGIAELTEAIEKNLASPKRPHRTSIVDHAALEALRERLARVGIDYSLEDAWSAIDDPDGNIAVYLRNFPELREAFDAARESSAHPQVADRYRWATEVLEATIKVEGSVQKRSLSDKIDAVLTHRVFGLMVFIGVMYVVFQSIYTFSKPVQDFIQGIFAHISDWAAPKLAGSPAFQSLICTGLIKGVGGMLVFLPQILILFFFISVLEGTGYLARAAFLMDRLLGWCGLNGRAFIPLLSSFACAIPGIMSARVMPDPKSRLATIMVAPLMSCSARLPVYLVVISAFIQPKYGNFWAGFTLFAMHLLGLIVAIPVVWIINRRMFKGKRLPFLLELPPYQWPKWRDVWLAMYFRAKVFVKTAGTVIVFMSIVIWALSYFPHASAEQEATWRQEYVVTKGNVESSKVDKFVDEQQLGNSVLGRFGHAIEPAFKPAGFDWRITTSILAAFPARETVVPSMGILFSLGNGVDEDSKDLQSAMADATWPDGRPLFTLATSISLMVFFALCAQCFSTLATVRRETNSFKWPIIMFVYMTGLAYLGSIAVQLIFRALGH